MIAAAVLMIAASVVVLVSGVGLIGIVLLSSSGQGASRHAPMFSSQPIGRITWCEVTRCR